MNDYPLEHVRRTALTPIPAHARIYETTEEADIAAQLFNIDAPTSDLVARQEYDGCHEDAPSRVGVWFVQTIRRPNKVERVVWNRIGWLI
jgi:hypothetical protein